jgi:hypothetical protein
MNPNQQLLKAVQFNTISSLRNRLSTDGFTEWLITPCRIDGMTPLEAFESGRWQEVAEIADETEVDPFL